MVSIKKNRTIYTGNNLNYISFPMGGIGAGMICLDGTGSFSHISIKHNPDSQKSAYMFAAFATEKKIPRVLEGPVPEWKIFNLPEAGNGLGYTHFGLPRCKINNFTSKFPFAFIKLTHPELPVKIEICGWSPFIPADADHSSLPVAGVEYSIKNTSTKKISGIFSFHCKNFAASNIEYARAKTIKNGFIHFNQSPDNKEIPGFFSIQICEEMISVNHWAGRGTFFDSHQILWSEISKAKCISGEPDQDFIPGSSTYTEVNLGPGESKTIKILFSWYVPESNMRTGQDEGPFYQPWYSGRFSSIEEINEYWLKNYETLKKITTRFTEAFYSSDVPDEIKDAISSNLSILKSPTVLRQKDGRLWCWEGCCEKTGCCAGSCTHVWNYCQAIAHLFPSLERSLRQTEFNENQDENGHQNFRALLPIRKNTHDFHAAADGQLGGIMKVYREWRICGDTRWLREIWDRVKKSMDYCISTWDPEHQGILKYPHHNTYDIEFWGPDGMCGSFYLGALKSIVLMGEFLNEDVSLYKDLYEKGKKYLENNLFNGEYFEQKIQWKDPGLLSEFEKLLKNCKSQKIVSIIEKQGPPYQYGSGCLADGVLGSWIAELCGIGETLDKKKVKKHLASVYKYNFKKDLSDHANPQRPGYAMGNEGGLILCTWPKGNKPTLPFPYSDEVWTGFEYQVAAHLMFAGFLEKGLEIVRTARKRYDGTKRNPFDEYECGHWYGRALSCYGLLYGLTGLRYDAIEKKLYLKPQIKGDFKVFFSTDSGWGIAGIKNKKPFVKILYGSVEVEKIIIENH